MNNKSKKGYFFPNPPECFSSIFKRQELEPLSSLWAAKVRGQKTVLLLLMPLLGEKRSRIARQQLP